MRRDARDTLEVSVGLVDIFLGSGGGGGKHQHVVGIQMKDGHRALLMILLAPTDHIFDVGGSLGLDR